MYKNSIIKSAKGIVVVKNKYLLQLRDNKKNVYYPNFWGLFGGGLNENETHKKCLEREINEETNLLVKATKDILSVNFNMINLKKKRQISYYICEILKKTNIILTEGQKYKFFSYNQITKINIVPMDFVAINSHYYKIMKYTSQNH